MITTVLVMIVLVILSAYFSATETAFSSLNRTRLRAMAEKNPKAERALAVSENYDKLLSTILVGNNLVNILLASIGTIFFVRLLEDNELGTTVSTAVITVVVLIFGEISPKSIVKESPEKFAIFTTPIISFLIIALTPINFLFSMWKKLLSKAFRINNDWKMTSDELLTFVDEVEEDGSIDPEETELLRSAIEFNDVEAFDILTPRVNVEGVSEDTPNEEVAQIFTDTGYSRLPVYRDSLDNIIGVVHQKDFYDGPQITTKPITEIMQEPVYVPPSIKVSDLLKQLQKEKSHIAVVKDEYGGTKGIITMEDILEELVGEIWDEHDEVIEEFIKVAEDTYRIKCSADLGAMLELFEFDEDDVETDSATVSGWVMEQLEKIPDKGDSFVWENLEVTVTSVENRRLMEIMVKVLPVEEKEEDE